MGISKRNIACWGFFLLQVRFSNGDSSVRQARAADLAQMVKMTEKCLLNPIIPRDVFESLLLAGLCPLSIGHMQEGQFVVLMSDRGANATVHPSANKYNRECFV